MENILKLKEGALTELEQVKNMKELERFRVRYLGRKGKLTTTLRKLKDLSLNERRAVGPEANQLKKDLEEAIKFRKKELAIEPSVSGIDITRPGKRPAVVGHLHPLTKIEQEVRRIFLSMNFSVIEGPEIETEYYNFDALNIPPFHPAREAWDTFWIKQETRGRKQETTKKPLSPVAGRLLLRTHTSPMQIRYMEAHQPPFQIIVPGRTFRYEATDATHETNFYQLEGLMVGKDVSLANFKFVVEKFFREFFAGKKVDFRFVPSYYPFVEPGLDVEIKFDAGRPRKGTSSPRGKWLEVMGAGMVHPNVFEAAHYNPREWQGFAFGVGLNRLAMIKYKIPDIRLFMSGDLRFINQF